MCVNDVLPLDVLDQVELLQRRYDVVGLYRRHVAELLDADRALMDVQNQTTSRINSSSGAYQRLNG